MSISEKPDWLFPVEFNPGDVPPPAWPPLPGVGIASAPQGGTPFVMLVDRYFRQMIGFTFCAGDSCAPALPGFTEVFRTPHEPRELWSVPMIMPDMHTVVGTDDGVVFSGPSTVPMPPVAGLGTIYATPTLAADGSVVVVNEAGNVSVLRDGAVLFQVPLSGNTIARAAASRSHVFVSTTEALYTLDANAAASVRRFPWSGGGIWSPVIGPKGHDYAMASNVLFVFRPPRTHGDPGHLDEVLRGGLASGSRRGTE
jgi:hypothetical protein